MIFKFSLKSEEAENFKAEIKIDGDASFFDLHKAIMECSAFEETEITSFFICDDWWKRKQEITLIEMDTDADVDSYVMEDEILSDWLDEEKQKLIFIFDHYADRGYHMKLSEMIFGESLDKAVCSKKQGKAPVQFLKEEEIEPIKPDAKKAATTKPLLEEDDETFYGDDDYNPDELDEEGFEDVDGADRDLNIPDERDLF